MHLVNLVVLKSVKRRLQVLVKDVADVLVELCDEEVAGLRRGRGRGLRFHGKIHNVREIAYQNTGVEVTRVLRMEIAVQDNPLDQLVHQLHVAAGILEEERKDFIELLSG